ncbi:MAG: 4-hydroxybenzoate octaprenyltransferase [Planctomycetes bacterium]|nr:4-hydroxybenzoate octaprenyltransferase [Planctomycetota bacterium]
MFKGLVTILRMIRFSHTVFALPFALLAAFLAGDGGAGGFCGWGKLGLIVWCMVWARSVAMTFNRIVDVEIDRRNPRTSDRALVTGELSRKKAWLFLAGCGVLFFLGAYWFWRPVGYPVVKMEGWLGYGNYWPTILAGPVLVFICLYSLTKRCTWGSHFWLGASLMLAPVAAWVAVCPPEGPVVAVAPVVLGVAVLLWTAGFDIIYACQDIEVDRKEGLYSLPAALGRSRALWVSRLCHSLTVTGLLGVGILADLRGGIYLGAVGLTAVLLVVEHILVVRGRVKLAFDLNGVIGIVLAGAGIWELLFLTPT